ncbi:MAG: bifunctional phosphopantothenoylcysteine decarboxylase/phosphopantothenate--cysteine ligase CoaBC [Hyphomicrobiaceae bacterium]
MSQKRVLLIISGGIAAYKSLDLVRRLREQDVTVRVILTRAAEQFITSLSATVLSGQEALTALFSPKDEAEIGHIEVSREADLIVVAPASADILAKMAHGIADDLATTALLATDTPVMAVPAMNVRMWTHAATQRNIAQLEADGIAFVGPVDGSMACGEFGPGRMSDVADIVDAVMTRLTNGAVQPALLGGRRVLVTAGPTHEPLDPVRYIANRSSGKQGYAIARAAAAMGAKVVLVSGPTNLPDPPGVSMTRVRTAEEMHAATEAALPADIAVFTAAVADWRAADPPVSKMKKTDKKPVPELKLVENPDILKAVARSKSKRPELVIGFAAETNDVVKHAQAKLKKKGCDWIVANDVSVSGALSQGTVMGGDLNRVHLVTAGGVEAWSEMTKDGVAERLMTLAAETLNAQRAAAE